MRKLFALVLVSSLLVTGAFAQARRVKGYTTKRGTYVAPHYRSKADHSRYNNWSTKGNRNPYTGKRGTRSPYGRRRH
jgi:hypothetical protein